MCLVNLLCFTVRKLDITWNVPILCFPFLDPQRLAPIK